MSWRGKLVGVLVGLLLGASLRRPWLLIVGLVLGHLYDRGAFGGGTRAEAPSGDARPDDPYAVLGIAPDASDEAQRRKRRLNVLGATTIATEIGIVTVNAALSQVNLRRSPVRRRLNPFR